MRSGGERFLRSDREFLGGKRHIDRDDESHSLAGPIWKRLVESNAPLITSNYILLETVAILQRRIGVGTTRVFTEQMLPLVSIQWIDFQLHNDAMSEFVKRNSQNLSLVDTTSFFVMRRMGIDTVFAFNKHFRAAGFTLIKK